MEGWGDEGMAGWRAVWGYARGAEGAWLAGLPPVPQAKERREASS